MYTYYYQIATISIDEKYCIKKLVYDEKKLDSYNIFYLSSSKLNLLLSNMSDNQYKKYNTDNLSEITNNFFDDDSYIFKPGSFNENILIKNHFQR